ncbi:MAG: hypothetical protein QME12_05060 [Nanoarchaeota archaeon]|nr:hypothetical protein [Nanoarchaeota archaeon]
MAKQNKLKQENRKLKSALSLLSSKSDVKKLNKAFQDLKEGRYTIR